MCMAWGVRAIKSQNKEGSGRLLTGEGESAAMASGNTGASGGALSGILEKTGFGILAHGLIGLKISKSAVPLDVQDSFQRLVVDEGRQSLM